MLEMTNFTDGLMFLTLDIVSFIVWIYPEGCQHQQCYLFRHVELYPWQIRQ